MSMNASKHELIQLIYRHLKEHGFHSAANELQRHSPQAETKISASLLDIYSSWLKDSKKKKQPDSTKLSNVKEQKRTPTKVKPVAAVSPGKENPADPVTPVAATPGNTSGTADISENGESTPAVVQTPKRRDSTLGVITASPVATPRRKKDKPATKAEVQKKTPVAAKRERSKGKSGESVTKAKKSKTQLKAEDVAAGGDDSDSDSSLDVEKWKKLVLYMTEADVAKMDTINALDSSATQPKKKTVRKPRAKPLAKTNTQGPQNELIQTTEKGGQKVVTETPVKNIKPKKRTTKKSAPATPSATPHKEQNAVEHTPTTFTLPPLKQTPTKVNINLVTPSEEKTEEATDEPKKKKKKDRNEEKGGTNTSETGKNGKVKDSKKEMGKKNEVTEQEFVDKPVKKKKAKETKVNSKSNENEEEMINNQTRNGDNEKTTESIIQEKKKEKKAKKKKKEKSDCEEKTEQTVEEDQTNSEPVAQSVIENTEPVVQGKKVKKKKEKSDAENSEKLSEENEIKKQMTAESEDSQVAKETLELISEEKKTKKKRERSDAEANSETIFKEKKKRKKDKDRNEEMSEQVEENTPNKSESSNREEKLQQIIDVRQKANEELTLNSDPVSLPPSNAETPDPPTEKKKKKKKSQSNPAEVPGSPVNSAPDGSVTPTLQMPPSTSKKKKKSSKITSP